ETLGGLPTAAALAPCRFNIIGEHTDYSGGLALPAAIDRYVAVGVRLRRDREIKLSSDRFGLVTLAKLPAARRGHWSDYLVGVARELAAAVGERGGFDAAIVAD